MTVWKKWIHSMTWYIYIYYILYTKPRHWYRCDMFSWKRRSFFSEDQSRYRKDDPADADRCQSDERSSECLPRSTFVDKWRWLHCRVDDGSVKPTAIRDARRRPDRRRHDPSTTPARRQVIRSTITITSNLSRQANIWGLGERRKKPAQPCQRNRHTGGDGEQRRLAASRQFPRQGTARETLLLRRRTR